MPDESRGIQAEGKPGAEASQLSLVPNIVVVSNDGEGKVSGRNIIELEDFTDNLKRSVKSRNGSTGSLVIGGESGLSASQVSVEVGVAKTAQAPEPNKANSLVRGAGADRDKLQSDSRASMQKNSCSDSDYGSSKSLPGYGGASLSTDSCDEELSELDGNVFEKASRISPINLSESSLNTSQLEQTPKNTQDDYSIDSKTDQTAKAKTKNSLSGSSPELPSVSPRASQSGDSIDVRWANEDDPDDDRRSNLSRQTVIEGVCCCYQATHRACLQCVEETPLMVSGLVLTLVFSLVIIIVLATTRVRIKVNTYLPWFSLGNAPH